MSRRAAGIESLCSVPVQGQNNTAGNPLTAVPVPGKSLYSLANGKEINAIHHSVPTDRLCCTPAPQQLRVRPFCFVQHSSAILFPRNSSQSCREVSPAERPIFLTRMILRFPWNILNLLFSPIYLPLLSQSEFPPEQRDLRGSLTQTILSTVHRSGG